MNYSAPFARFSVLDLFGVLMPGFFMLATVAFVFLDISKGREGSSVVEALQQLAAPLEHWASVPVVLFMSYLLGSIPRAFVVATADNLCAKVRRRLLVMAGRKLQDARNSWRRSLLTAKFFPYPKAMRCTLAELLKHREASKHVVRIGKEDRPGIMAVFDYWKLVLCMREPRAFAYIQMLEARVRFFVGMFWAGIVGTGSAVVGAVVGSKSTDWLMAFACMFVLSGLITVVFGMRLRFVRGEEACQVLSAYVAHKTL